MTGKWILLCVSGPISKTCGSQTVLSQTQFCPLTSHPFSFLAKEVIKDFERNIADLVSNFIENEQGIYPFVVACTELQIIVVGALLRINRAGLSTLYGIRLLLNTVR